MTNMMYGWGWIEDGILADWPYTAVFVVVFEFNVREHEDV